MQVMKLLGTENARGGTRLFFLVGGRAIAALSGAALHETAMNKVRDDGSLDILSPAAAVDATPVRYGSARVCTFA